LPFCFRQILFEKFLKISNSFPFFVSCPAASLENPLIPLLIPVVIEYFVLTWFFEQMVLSDRNAHNGLQKVVAFLLPFLLSLLF
jgi:hypothetical protein